MCQFTEELEKDSIPVVKTQIVHDIEVNGELPFIAGRKKGSLLIMGPGMSLWDDVAKVHSRFKGDRMALNHVIIDYPDRLEHACSCHPYVLLLFTLYRRHVYSRFPHTYSHSVDIYDRESQENHLIPQFTWDFPEYYYGSSALTGVLAGLVMGYDNIILAGIGMDKGGYYYNPYWVYPYDERFLNDWEKANKKCFHGKVTSLSGNTRELLGEPKNAYLRG